MAKFWLFEWIYCANSFVPIDLWPVFEGNVDFLRCILEAIDFLIDPYYLVLLLNDIYKYTIKPFTGMFVSTFTKTTMARIRMTHIRMVHIQMSRVITMPSHSQILHVYTCHSDIIIDCMTLVIALHTCIHTL